MLRLGECRGGSRHASASPGAARALRSPADGVGLRSAGACAGHPVQRALFPAATLALYLALTTWLTWPLAIHAGTHLPDLPISRMDVLYGVWALAWQTHALVTAPASLLDANIYYPARHALLYGPMGIGTLPYFAPPFLATGNPALAANLALLGCVALAACGLHRVVVRWTGSELGGLVAGCAFLTTPWVLCIWMAPRPVHFVLLYIPWIISLVARRACSVRHDLLLATLLVLQCLADPLYVAPAVAVPVAMVALWRTLRPASRAMGIRLAATLTIALLALAPIYAGYAVMRAENPSLAVQSVWRYREPPGEHPPEGLVLAGGLYADIRPTGVPWPVVPVIVIGLVSFLFRPAAQRDPTRPVWIHGALWVVVGLLISIPALIVPAEPQIVVRSPLFVFLQWLGPEALDSLRGKMRLGVGALIGLTLLAGVAFAECQRRLPGRGGWAGFILAAVLIAAMYGRWPARTRPYPIAEAPTPHTPIVDALRGASGPVLELPAGLGPSDSFAQAEAMYRSIFHWRPLLNGYSSYWPIGFPERMELAAQLPSPEALERLHRDTGVETILVHAGGRGSARWLDLAARSDGPLRLVVRHGTDLLFAVREPLDRVQLPAARRQFLTLHARLR